MGIRDVDNQLGRNVAALTAEIPIAKGAGDLVRVREISEALRGHKLAIDANKRCWSALRLVQDGIVWRAFGYDRFRIAILGSGQPVTWMSASFDSEVAAAEVHWDAGRVALLCDLAGCVNIGDLLVFHDEEPRVRLIELKESERISKDTRQFEQIRARIEFLSTGSSNVFGPYRLFGPPENAPRLRTHLSMINDAFVRAQRQGFAFTRAGGAYIASTVDTVAALRLGEHAAQVERLQRTEEHFKRGLPSVWADVREQYMFDSLTRIDRDRSHPVSSTAPLSIFPFSEELCAKLMLGYAGYRVTLNLRLLDAALQRGGWTRVQLPATMMRPPNMFIAVQRGDLVQAVPLELAEQLVVELLTVAAFVDSIDSCASARGNGREVAWHSAWSWSGENRVWR